MATVQPSYVRQNYHRACEVALSTHIHLELYASHVYLSIGFYFQRDDVALSHFANFFLQQSSKEKEQVEKLMWLQNQRGGFACLEEISRPQTDQWENSLQAMEFALRLAKKVNQSLMNLHRLATEKKDTHLCDFLGNRYLHKQVKFIKELGGHVTSLHKMGAPEADLAEYLFDKLTLSAHKKN